MKRLSASGLILGAAVAVVAVAQAAEQGDAVSKGVTNIDRFELFKKLAGDWEGKETSGHHPATEVVRVKYKVTSGGSTIVETLFPDTEHEMVSVLHPDGKEIVMTHYCMIGNQPHMKAPAQGDGKTVVFTFTHATNLKSPNDHHMHHVTYTFLDKDSIKSEWVSYKDGKEQEKAVFELKRKK
jgi:hypothetical protein